MTYITAPGILPEKKTVNYVLNTISDYYGVSKDELIKKGRKREMVKRKHFVRYFLHIVLEMSLTDIGKLFLSDYKPRRKSKPYNDHTTVMHSIETIKNLLKVEDPIITKDYLVLAKRFGIAAKITTLEQKKTIVKPDMPEAPIVRLTSKWQYSNHSPLELANNI